MANPRTRKSCVVPKCRNTTVNSPEKLFCIVPKDINIRKIWLKAMNRLDPFGDKSVVYCCEDHFDIESDLENYIKFKLVGGPIRLKRGIVPHKFKCQEKEDKPNRKIILKEISSARKREHTEYSEKIVNRDESSALQKNEKSSALEKNEKSLALEKNKKSSVLKKNEKSLALEKNKKSSALEKNEKSLALEINKKSSALEKPEFVACCEDELAIDDPLSFGNNDRCLEISKRNMAVQVNLNAKGVDQSTMTENKYFKRKRRGK